MEDLVKEVNDDAKGTKHTKDKHNALERDAETPDQPTTEIGADLPKTEDGETAMQRKRYPLKGSDKYGIKKSLERMAVKYVPPKIEIPKLNHPCAPCFREQKHKEASFYCQDCKEKLCQRCSNQHGKFQILQTHKIVPVQEAPPVIDNQRPKLLGLAEQCTTHAGKVISLFCREHDEVVCPACVATTHRECPEAVPISKVAAELTKPATIKATKDDLTVVKKDLFLVKLKKLSEKNKIVKERDTILATIDNVKTKVLDSLEKFESDAKEKLNRKFDQDMRSVKRDIQVCESLNNNLDDTIRKMKTSDPRLLMIHMKRDAKRRFLCGKRALESVTGRTGKVGTQFTVDEDLEEWLKSWSALGHFNHEETIFIGIPVGSFELSQSCDHELTDYVFNSMVSLPTGNIVVCDWKNKRLKLLDGNYKIIGLCETLGMPYCATSVSENVIAVTIRDEKLIQFVSVSDRQMKLERNFKTDEYCRGIACKEGVLYITCGGEGEVQGQVRGYSMQGQLVQTFIADIHERPLFLQPKDIVINADGIRFHVLDLKKGIVTFTKDRRLVNIYKDSGLKTPLGLCLDGFGNVYVSDRDSNQILQLNPDGIKLCVVLTDGLEKPLTICCQEGLESKILVAMENNSMINVYTLQERF